MKKFFLIIILATVATTIVSAQQGWEAGGWGGAAWYLGDLNTNFDFTHPGPAAGAAARYNFNDRVSLKFSACYGRVRANDTWSKNEAERARNLHFRSDLFEGDLHAEFNFLPYVHGSRDHFFTPYAFAGLTMVRYNPQAQYQGKWVDLRPLGTEGQFRGEEYFTMVPALGLGGGLKVDLNYYWSLNFEVGLRYMSNDYLDDVSTVYPDMDDIDALHGPIAVALSDPSVNGIGTQGKQRGNSHLPTVLFFHYRQLKDL